MVLSFEHSSKLSQLVQCVPMTCHLAFLLKGVLVRRVEPTAPASSVLRKVTFTNLIQFTDLNAFSFPCFLLKWIFLG